MSKDDEQVMTVLELAQHLRVHPSTIYRMLKKHEIPSFRVGSDWRFLKSSIQTWMEGQIGAAVK